MLRIDREAIKDLSPSEQDDALRLLSEYENALKANPLLGYRPHVKQRTFHASHEPLKLFFGGNRCIAGFEHVRMGNGTIKPINEIQVGERVLCADLAGNTSSRKVLAKYANGRKPISRWEFSKRETKLIVWATSNHKFVARREGQHGNVMRPVGELHSRWSVQRQLGFDGYRDIRDEDKGYTLLYGLLLGDGCVTRRRVQFHCADDELLHRVKIECEALGLRLHSNRANYAMHTIAQVAQPVLVRNGVGQFEEGSRNVLLDRLEHHGIHRKAYEKTIPSEARGWSNDDIGCLVKGLLATDGSVWSSEGTIRVGFTSVSRALANGLKELLEDRFGVYGSRLLEQQRPDKRPEYSFTIGNYWSLRRLYEKVGLLGEKGRKLREGVFSWKGKKSDASRLLFRSGTPDGECDTYDLLVDHPDHAYVLANGLIVSNSGKTTAGILDDIIQAVDADVVPEHLKPYKRFHPPFHCRIVAPDFTSTMEGVIFQKLREWLPASQLTGERFDKAYEKTNRRLTFKNGSTFDFLTFEQDLDKFGGAAKHRIHYDESPPRDIRRESMMRLIDYGGDELFTLTPLHGLNWLYEEFWEPWRKGNLAETTVVLVDMDDNPYIDDKAKKRALAGASREEIQARKSGRFVHFAGLIYDEFTRSDHVIPELEALPPQSRVYVGIDPGMRHMCAVLWTYLDQDDCLTVFDELGLQDHNIAQVCEAIKLVNRKWGSEVQGKIVPLTPSWYVIDPAARNVMHNTGRSDQMEYTKHGVVTILGQNSVTAGISVIKERLQTDRLKVTANCQQTIDQFRKYRWKSESRSEDAPKEQPVKRDDHLLDSLRYVAMSMPQAAEREEREEEANLTPLQRAINQDIRNARRPRIPKTSYGGVYA